MGSGNPHRCKPLNLSVRPDDREWLLRVGEGNASRGLRRAIKYAKAMRHDLNGMRNPLTLWAALMREKGQGELAEHLIKFDRWIGETIARATAAEG